VAEVSATVTALHAVLRQIARDRIVGALAVSLARHDPVTNSWQRESDWEQANWIIAEIEAAGLRVSLERDGAA